MKKAQQILFDLLALCNSELLTSILPLKNFDLQVLKIKFDVLLQIMVSAKPS